MAQTTQVHEPAPWPAVHLGLPRRNRSGTDGLDSVELDHAARMAAVRSGSLGSVHSWELVTAVDGPGTRLTVFLAGCPLQCLYCHNPDTMQMRRGTDVTADEILARVARYRGVFAATGGGLTISGGEPLMQPAFVRRILRGARELGVHTAIDTSGFLGARATDDLLGSCNLVLLDIKSWDRALYRRLTGRDLHPTVAFARRLADRGTPVWVRFVLVPGLTDDPDNVGGVARFAAGLGNVERVDVLPFHRLAVHKYEELGLPFPLADVEPPDEAMLARALGQFRGAGLLAV